MIYVSLKCQLHLYLLLKCHLYINVEILEIWFTDIWRTLRHFKGICKVKSLYVIIYVFFKIIHCVKMCKNNYWCCSIHQCCDDKPYTDSFYSSLSPAQKKKKVSVLLKNVFVEIVKVINFI